MTSLEQDAVMCLESAAGTRLTVHAGRVWITETGLPDDVFLDGGQHYLVSTQGRVVLEAVGAPALVEVAAPGLAPTRRAQSAGPARPLLGLARRWPGRRIGPAA